MFNVTESARLRIAEFFTKHERQPIRVFLFDCGCGDPRIVMALDKQKNNDAIFVISGVQYVIDKGFLEQAAPVQIDHQMTGFKIKSSLRFGGECGGCCSGDSCHT